MLRAREYMYPFPFSFENIRWERTRPMKHTFETNTFFIFTILNKPSNCIFTYYRGIVVFGQSLYLNAASKIRAIFFLLKEVILWLLDNKLCFCCPSQGISKVSRKW